MKTDKTDAEIKYLARAYVKKLPALEYKSVYDFGIQNMAAFSCGYKACQEEDGWISVKDAKPELKTFYDESVELYVREVSKEVIVTDEETTWTEWYSEDFGFHESITRWQYLPSPPQLTNTKKA